MATEDETEISSMIDRSVSMTFRLSSFKAHVVNAFSEHMLDLDVRIKQFIEALDFDKIIDEAIKKAVESHVREAVDEQAKLFAEGAVADQTAVIMDKVKSRVLDELSCFVRFSRMEQDRHEQLRQSHRDAENKGGS